MATAAEKAGPKCQSQLNFMLHLNNRQCWVALLRETLPQKLLVVARYTHQHCLDFDSRFEKRVHMIAEAVLLHYQRFQVNMLVRLI
jgi:hypothetical protein